MEVGLAESVQVGAGGVSVTVTFTPQVTEPPGPVAVPVYVVVTSGVIEREPETGGIIEPTL